jgi:hypothetical protein
MFEKLTDLIFQATALRYGETDRSSAETLARLTLQTMRVPTEDMVEAAYKAHDAFERASEGSWCGLSSAYKAMIDSALAQPQSLTPKETRE